MDDSDTRLLERDHGRRLVNDPARPDLLQDRLGINLPDDHDYSMLAGFALSVLTHLPATGQLFGHEGWKFEVVDMDGRKIDKLLAVRRRKKREDEEAAI